jgi:hypothetical protein
MRQTALVVKARLAGWFGGLIGVIVAMVAAGQGSLAPPDLRHPSTWGAWAQTRAAPDASMAVLRLVVLALAVYLLVVSVLALVLRIGDVGRAVSVVDVVTLPFVRSIVQAGLGVGLVGATVAGVAAHPAPRSAPTSADAAIVATDPSPPPTIAAAPDPVGSGRDAGPSGAQIATRTEAPARTWTVAPGEHLWSIAERALGASLGRAPTEAEVVPYWRALIDANRPSLADPDNPDLIFSGQVLTLPQ